MIRGESKTTYDLQDSDHDNDDDNGDGYDLVCDEDGYHHDHHQAVG